MEQDNSLIWLAGSMDKWLSVSRKRNLHMLHLKSGVSYATIRRVYNMESLPNDDTCLSILSVTATIEEFLSFFEKKNPVFHRFLQQNVGRLSTRQEESLVSRMNSREGFLCMALAYTIGVRIEDMEKLSGSLGLAIMDGLIDDGFLIEKEPGVFRPQTDDELQVHNLQVSKHISRFIADMSLQHEDSQNNFFCYNVTQADLEKIQTIMSEAFFQARHIARQSEGPVPLAHCVISTRILDN